MLIGKLGFSFFVRNLPMMVESNVFHMSTCRILIRNIFHAFVFYSMNKYLLEKLIYALKWLNTLCKGLNKLKFSRLKIGLQICAVKAPGFGESKKELLRDIGVSCGKKKFYDLNNGVF